MAPAISHLQGFEIHHSLNSSAAPSAAQSAEGATRSAAPAAPAAGKRDYTPKSSFKITMPDMINMDTPAAVSPAAREAYAPVAKQTAKAADRAAAGVAAGDSTNLGLLRANYGGGASAVVSREPSKPLLVKESGKVLRSPRGQGRSFKQQQYGGDMEGQDLFELAAGAGNGAYAAARNLGAGMEGLTMEDLAAERLQ